MPSKDFRSSLSILRAPMVRIAIPAKIWSLLSNFTSLPWELVVWPRFTRSKGSDRWTNRGRRAVRCCLLLGFQKRFAPSLRRAPSPIVGGKLLLGGVFHCVSTLFWSLGASLRRGGLVYKHVHQHLFLALRLPAFAPLGLALANHQCLCFSC